MVIKFSGHNNHNIPYEYYVCSGKQNKNMDKCTTKNIRVTLLDSIILDKLNLYNKQIFLDTLKKSLDSLNINCKNQQVINIEAKIKENELQLNNLIKQLSKATSELISNKIMQEINSLDKTIQNLNNQLSLLKSSEKLVDATNHIDIEKLTNSLSSLKDTLTYIEDISQKRILLQTIVKCVIWDSDANNVEIILK